MRIQKIITVLLVCLILLAVHKASRVAYAISGIPANQDTDGDGLPDIEEDTNNNAMLDTGETDPYNADTDRGGESDGSEVRAGRNPLDQTDDMTYDADSDGWVNGIEAIRGTDPKIADSDSDGVKDAIDPFPLDSKYSQDANTNNLPDEWEATTGLAASQVTPTRSDDPDGDGLTNAEELAKGANPLSTDTDRDGVGDKAEIDRGTPPDENACLSFSGAVTGFPDVEAHWSRDLVRELGGLRILPDDIPFIRGFDQERGPALFLPDRPVSRYEFLKMTVLSACMGLRSQSEKEPIQFTDIRSDAPINENADTALKRRIIYTAVHYKIVQGYADGTFLPDAPVNRAEAVAILLHASKLPPLDIPGSSIIFTDVDPDAWYGSTVSEAAARSIVEGYGDGTFRPGQSITRAEAAAMIRRALQQNPAVNGYVLP